MSNNIANNLVGCDASSLERALLGVFIGDAYGAGWEMKSRQYILEHFKELDERYKIRDPDFGKNFRGGKYTDDAEMTLAVLYALKAGKGCLTKESLISWFVKVYQENKQNTGFRDGYGSFLQVAEETDPEKRKQLLQKIKVKQAGKEPGNGAMMRIMPALFYSASGKNFYNAIVNSLATHPHPLSVFGSLAMLASGDFLFWKKGNPEQLIPYVIKTLDLILNDNTVFQEEKELLESDDVYPHTLQSHFWSQFKTKLEEIDQHNAPIDDVSSNLDFETLVAPYAKPCNGGIGLSAKAEQTTYCVLYLLKWSNNTPIYSTLKRCVTIGGDTDSLASIVLSYLMLYKDLSQPVEEMFPEWTVQQLEGKHIIERIVKEHK